MKRDSDSPSILLPRLDDGEGPAEVLSGEEERALVKSAMLRCGLQVDADSVLRSASGGMEAERESMEVRIQARTGRGERLVDVRTPARKTKGRGLRVATVVVIVASSTAAAALTGAFSDVPDGFRPWTWFDEDPPPALPDATPVSQKPVAKLSVDDEEEAAAPTSVPESSSDVPPGKPTKPVLHDNPRAPEDLLGEANALRAERRFDEALEKYLGVILRHPTSAQATAARVAAGTLKLEHRNDPAGARDLLEPLARGSRVPEALVMLARVYRSTGERERERGVLSSFVSRHSDHPLVPIARRRLAALEGPDESE